MKKEITREVKVKIKYMPTKNQTDDTIKYLKGEISCRELGKRLGYSHQQAINFVSSICRQWIQEGKLNPTKKNNS